MKGRYYVMTIKGSDEFLICKMPTESGAIRMARMEWDSMNDLEKYKSKIEVRAYKEDICSCYDYDTIDWQVG